MSPKRCLVALVYNYCSDRVKVALFEQRGLRQALVDTLGDALYGFDKVGIANFTMKISRKGNGLETSYSLLPKAGKDAAAKERNAFAAVRETSQAALLLEGKHPLRKPTEFSSNAGELEF